MGQMHVAFELSAHHGCLVLRDSGSNGDVSDWDPELEGWHFDDSSAIFGVRHGVTGR